MEVRFVVFLCADALDNYIYRAHHPQLIPEMRVTRPVRASKNQIPPRTRGQKNRHHQVGRLSLILHPPPVDPLDQWLRFAHGAISPNTERALRADLGIYRSWCEHRQLIPWPVNATPLAWFIDSMASQRAPATVRRYVASIAALCRADGRKNPLDSVMVTTALQRMQPAERPPPGPGPRPHLGPAGAAPGCLGRPPDRRAQPRAAGSGLRRAAAEVRTGVPASA